MLEQLEALSRRFVSETNRPFRRYFLDKWKLDQKLSIVVGQRGVGKTTCLVQHLADELASAPEEGSGRGRRGPPAVPGMRGLFVQLDHVTAAGINLYELAGEFHGLGGRLLCLDEVHKYAGWQGHLKSIHDTFPALRIVASGSSALQLRHGIHDLSRRAAVLPMEILPFREYIALSTGLALPAASLSDMLAEHEQLAREVVGRLSGLGLKVLALFREYLRVGSYPYFLDVTDENLFLMAVEQTVRTTVESDLLAVHPTLTGAAARRMERLLAVIAASVPFVPDMRGLARSLDIGDERTVKTYMMYMEEAGVLRSLSRSGRGLRQLEKPDKIYLGSTGQAHALAVGRNPETGTVRETFALSMLAPWHKVVVPDSGDFLVDGTIRLEVGGPGKTASQIRGRRTGFVVADGIEVGLRRRIPLWLLGFLY
jgi:predicted AAA+ superfamily ATPase